MLDVPIAYGSDAVWDNLLGLRDDPEFEEYRPAASFGADGILRAINIARNCVLAHYDVMAHVLDPETCRAIGGHIHIAQITPARGFDWAIAPLNSRQQFS